MLTPTDLQDAEGVSLSIFTKRAKHPLRQLLGHSSKLYILHATESEAAVVEPIDKAHDQSVLQEDESEANMISMVTNTFVTVGSQQDAERVGFCGAVSNCCCWQYHYSNGWNN
jgi:hypothetical protein